MGARLCRCGLCLHQSLDVDRPLCLCRRPSHRQLQRADFSGRLEGGYRFGTFYRGLTPYAAIQAQNFRTPGYSETDLTAGGFALSYNSRTATDTRSELGARFDKQMRLDPYRVLALRARLAWAHDWIGDPTLAAIFQTLPGASFIVNGATPAKNSALTSAGAELRLANGVSLLAKWSSPPTPPRMPVPARCDIRGEACPGRSATCSRVPGAAQHRR
jgi:uncharacterized protein with beta-barrel porin domain